MLSIVDTWETTKAAFSLLFSATLIAQALQIVHSLLPANRHDQWPH